MTPELQQQAIEAVMAWAAAARAWRTADITVMPPDEILPLLDALHDAEERLLMLTFAALRRSKEEAPHGHVRS